MSVTEALLWVATVWAVFLAFVIVDVPDLLGRAVGHLRQQHLPHWARHGHVPPAEAAVVPAHGRHAHRSKNTSGGNA